MIDRDKILIPHNWDSWGKIRILREGFELETVANAWSVEIQSPPEAEYDASTAKDATNSAGKADAENSTKSSAGKETTLSIFTASLPNPFAKTKPFVPSTRANDTVTVQDMQAFLAEQAQILEAYRQEDERADRGARKVSHSSTVTGSLTQLDNNDDTTAVNRAKLSEHTGPYNINVGGIQVDAEEVTRRIREREADRDREGIRTPRKEVGTSGPGSGVATPDGGKVQNEALANYFAGLMKKAKGSSESPRGGSASGGER